MSHSCNGKSCSEGHHGHSASDCGCCCHKQCGCPCHHKQKYADQLIEIADEAWMEVLKEKIKDEIRKKSGDHLTQMAQLVNESNHKRWVDKIDERKNAENFDDRLRDLLFKHQ
jgi:hypothetical protein